MSVSGFSWNEAPKVRPLSHLHIRKEPVEKYYSIIYDKIVGEGVNGFVYRCVSIETKQPFVLKTLLKHEVSLREIQTQWMCSNSENIVQIHEVFECEIANPKIKFNKQTNFAIVMELMGGGDLFDFLSSRQSFTEVEAQSLVRMVANGVFHIHSLNIAHRDLKPENMLLSIPAASITGDFSDLRLKISDFGYAREDNNQLQSPLYTPYYVPPEILTNDILWPGSHLHFYDKTCDMWSFGVIVYIILCGFPPFFAENDSDDISLKMVENIKHAKFDFPEQSWKDVSQNAKDLIKHLLVVDSTKRLTAVDVLIHPWLNEHVPSTPLTSSANIGKKDAAMLANLQTLSQIREEMRAIIEPNKMIPLTEATSAILKRREKN